MCFWILSIRVLGIPLPMKSLIHILGDASVVPQQQRSAADKEQALLQCLANLSSVIVALSGGTDSAYLAWAAHRALGDRALSVTAVSPSFAAHDRAMVDQFVAAGNLQHTYVD